MTNSSKGRCWNMSKNLCLIDWSIVDYKALGSTFIPCSKSYNRTRLGLKFQIKRNPYTKRILMTQENIKLLPRNRSGHFHGSNGNFHAFLQNHRQTIRYSHRQTSALVIGMNTSSLLDLVIFNCSSYRQPSSSATSLQTSYRCSICRSILYRSPGTCPKTVSTVCIGCSQ